MFICEIDNVLTVKECTNIIDASSICNFQDMDSKYDPKKDRNNSRLLVLDPDLARYLWSRIETVLLHVTQDKDITLCPLGFDVLRGHWEFCGLNEGVRVNRYSSDRREYFAPHKDAQYCPSGDKRSIFSLILYLNEGFQGGGTYFYLPKNVKEESKAMTTEEEIETEGGLENGFDPVNIIPRTGLAVLFSQNILHESSPLVTPETPSYKFVLKTDIMLKRIDKPLGFSVSREEKEDYFECLNYFRQAQQKELEGKISDASVLYELALSLRYCYPAALKNAEHSTTAIVRAPATKIFPACVWENIFTHLNGQDAERLVYVFPELYSIKRLQDERSNSKLEARLVSKRPLFYPKIDLQHGIYTFFEFPDADFFEANEEGCCRVAAMYSFFLLGHSPSNAIYTVRFNPDTQEVCAVPLDKLLWDVFYNQPCYGTIYKVKQQGKLKDAYEDFVASVDRNYMLLRHNSEFMGVDVSDTFRTTTRVFKDSQSSDDSFDEMSSDKSYDDSDDSSTKLSPKKEGIERGQVQIEREESGDSECNTICIGGEEDVIVKNDIFLRMLDTVGFFTPLDLRTRENDDSVRDLLFGMCSCGINGLNTEPIKDAYLKELLNRSDDHTSVSATLVSSLNQPLTIDRHDLCYCPFTEFRDELGGAGSKEFSEMCEVNMYNHLVFDFQESQLIVEHICDDLFSGKDCSPCFLRAVLDKHVKSQSEAKIKNAFSYGDMKHFTVRIHPLAQPYVPFNHASCECVFPSFEVYEYVNLKDYPFLNHIHLITQEIDSKMYVWSIYGGIVAM